MQHMALFKAPFNDRDLCDDWIYDDVAEGQYIVNESRIPRFHDIAFFRNGILFRACWTYGDNHLTITQLSFGTNDRLDTAMQDIMDICTSCNKDTDTASNTIVCDLSVKRIDGCTACIKAMYYSYA